MLGSPHLLALALGAALVASSPAADGVGSHAGMYLSAAGALELHRAPDGTLRGYLRTAGRVAALTGLEPLDGMLSGAATYDDGTRAQVRLSLRPGPALRLDGIDYRLAAVEGPASDGVRREIEAAYARLAEAVQRRDYEAFQALRIAEFATIPPDGVPSPNERMAARARGFLAAIQPPITGTHELLELTVRGDDAIATVRQKLTRRQLVEGTLHTVHTEVTQRETWTRTPTGWKLSFVDEVRDPLRVDQGPVGAPPSP